METHTKIRVCTTYWVVKLNAFQTLHNLYSLSFDLNLSVWLNVFYKGGAAACPVIPGFPLQAATNEAHLPSRENKAEPHSQSSICCYIGGLWIGVWAMSVDWRRAVWRLMCSSVEKFLLQHLPSAIKWSTESNFYFCHKKIKLDCKWLWSDLKWSEWSDLKKKATQMHSSARS